MNLLASFRKAFVLSMYTFHVYKLSHLEITPGILQVLVLFPDK